MSMADKKTLSYEEEFDRLRKAASLVEEGQGTLEELVSAYAEGVEAAKSCLSLLAQAEEEVQHLSAELDAMIKEQDHD